MSRTGKSGSDTDDLVIGQTLGVTDWYTVRQPVIDVFGAITEDLEPLHNDPDWCLRNSPYGAPIAFGFLSLSLLTKWVHEATDRRWCGSHDSGGFPINYGMDRVRLLAPVRVDTRVRAHVVLKDMRRHKTGHMLFTFAITVEREEDDRPALVADWLLLWVPN
jgi:acyl dehydratase